jgi:ferric-dicitrate binding protein FerR (iron transport regulator)
MTAAARWHHRVDVGEIKDDDPALHEWLSSNPRHYVAYRLLELAWERAGTLL